MDTGIVYPRNVTFYNFSAIKPTDGHCAWQQFGYVGPFAEPFSAIFGIIVANHGIVGLKTSQHVSVGSRYMFSLLLGYGLSSAAHTATLWNGFEKTSGAILNLMQAVIIIRLVNTLKFPPFNAAKHYHLISAVLMSTFGIYPIIAHVVGASFENYWISWLTFDLIWAVILVILIIIFKYRKEYPQYNTCSEAFQLIFNASISCILAYAFWLMDAFVCTKLVAILQFYGLWLLLMGLTFYYLAVLDAFLQSDWQGFTPVITRWPKKFVILFVYISWEPRPRPTSN